MGFIEIIKYIIFGIVEGITEWLPISSTGHLIILEKLIPLNMSSEFYSLFEVVIQFGAVIAVIIIFWNKIWPLEITPLGQIKLKNNAKKLWINIIVSCIPAVIIGLLLDDFIDAHFYNYIVVSLSLIVVGIVFIYIENKYKSKRFKVTRIENINVRLAFIIGLFQVLAAIFPGTSRSGATIIGALIFGVSRSVACEYTFYLAIPVMAGASFLKIFKYFINFGFDITGKEVFALIFTSVISLLVSLVVIKKLMNYVKKNSFVAFGYYRIAIGIVVLLLFSLLF